jgi:hypothetical protein
MRDRAINVLSTVALRSQRKVQIPVLLKALKEELKECVD